MKKNSPKSRRVNEEVAHELANIIRGLKDPRIAVMTSVMDAYVASDLKTCKVYISVRGDEEQQKKTMEGLRSAEGYIRRELAHSLNLRNTPELTFVLDRSIERGARMSRLIDEVMAQSAPVEENDEA
jgi:ribosome-binding factor A